MKSSSISRRKFLVTGSALATCPVALASRPIFMAETATGTPAGRSDDDKDVRELIASFAAAWSRHDVKGMGSSHTDDVDFINIWGSWEKGRVAIEKGFAEGHASVFSQSKMVIDVDRVRFPAPNVAVVHSTMELLNVPAAFGGKCHSIRVLVKSSGRWLISDFQNTQIRMPPE